MIYKESDSPIIQWQIYIKNSPKQKVYTAKESPLSAEQNDEKCFCIGYFVYDIRGIKCMHVQKPL